MTGWVLFGCGAGFLGDCTAAGPLLAQWPNAAGPLNVGSISIRSSKDYQVPSRAGAINLTARFVPATLVAFLTSIRTLFRRKQPIGRKTH